MVETLARNWWLVLVRGLFAIVFGILVIALPADIVVTTLMVIIAAYFLVDGGFSIGHALMNRSESGWWVGLFEGAIGVLAGFVAFVYPGLTALVLLYIFAFWAIVTGVIELWAAYELRKHIEGEWLMAVGGVLSMVLGIVLILFPGSGILAALWVIGAYAILFGILLSVLAFRLRGVRDELTPQRREQNQSAAYS